jgi:hypothetical protein
MDHIEQASQFMEANARLVERRRFHLLFGEGDPQETLAALAAHRNPDGGFGWALHPDLRSASSQPVAALHAFDVLEEVAPLTSPLAAGLCDWLERVSLADGALPFALAGAASSGSAPMWGESDPGEPSLLITAGLCAAAHRVAEHDPAVAGHPWVARATEYCMREIEAMETATMAIALRFALQLLDALSGKRPAAAAELERVAAFAPESWTMPVPGGAEGESMRPLDFSPVPGRPLRALLGSDVVATDLDRLASQQEADGSWNVDWHVYSPAADLEWRGDATLRALKILGANGRLDG